LPYPVRAYRSGNTVFILYSNGKLMRVGSSRYVQKGAGIIQVNKSKDGRNKSYRRKKPRRSSK